jgi:hypothetical protein
MKFWLVLKLEDMLKNSGQILFVNGLIVLSDGGFTHIGLLVLVELI